MPGGGQLLGPDAGRRIGRLGAAPPAASGTTRGPRQAHLDGFDLHSGQDWMHWYLLYTLSQAMAAFHKKNQDNLVADSVTAFTQSEFSRTFQPSGTGSDHAWGAHQVVVGGSVKGGIYGAMPTFAFQGPDDANTRGVWIPKISTSQFGATLGKWFGAGHFVGGPRYGSLSMAEAERNLRLFAGKVLPALKAE